MPNLAATAPHPGRRIFLGLAVSLLLHALLLTVLRPPVPSLAPDARRWAPALEVSVQLLPPPPAPITEPAPPPVAPAEARRPETKKSARPEDAAPRAEQQRERQVAAKPAPRRKSPEAIYVPAPAAPDVATEPTPTDTAPRFDPEAAKAAARNIASSLDEPKSDAPNAQVHRGGPRYRETKEQRLARDIKDSARPNCKDGIPGGLLAPLYLMMDKKDSGCKW